LETFVFNFVSVDANAALLNIALSLGP